MKCPVACASSATGTSTARCEKSWIWRRHNARLGRRSRTFAGSSSRACLASKLLGGSVRGRGRRWCSSFFSSPSSAAGPGRSRWLEGMRRSMRDCDGAISTSGSWLRGAPLGSKWTRPFAASRGRGALGHTGRSLSTRTIRSLSSATPSVSPSPWRCRTISSRTRHSTTWPATMSSPTATLHLAATAAAAASSRRSSSSSRRTSSTRWFAAGSSKAARAGLLMTWRVGGLALWRGPWRMLRYERGCQPSPATRCAAAWRRPSTVRTCQRGLLAVSSAISPAQGCTSAIMSPNAWRPTDLQGIMAHCEEQPSELAPRGLQRKTYAPLTAEQARRAEEADDVLAINVSLKDAAYAKLVQAYGTTKAGHGSEQYQQWENLAQIGHLPTSVLLHRGDAAKVTQQAHPLLCIREWPVAAS
ncbi:hypothetical protein BDZ90DRAFT_185530 [Jaminaea rosea]|uniref:Uncharacterized protein n=1 Tax=Jaminaea rosea TaxID=1569628 RepID=A0A316UP70_9BASI|nr:hypothetical protein BDZ90DRAFT_185530 [Jaminaea rosea]PWN27079.1 hypothetical protein BDZ90DRAFT_185530 [Jaminaea rosea]